ncbi:LCP family protein [Candidatus Contubernalis alkaliaceticus]|uniref:LCP family protein n=1 Tax=Candidatus Contubernalis alkaliaceticus TaxID=338645 RepID=UPI001F4BD6B6|nr:LCP family protein [Candidatus Contubernalis alkalaceticus]UNC93326.1 LCP family protein [Candidatus Contubernalis alkalaceticus]
MQRKKTVRLKKKKVIFLSAVLLFIALLLITVRIVSLLNSLQIKSVVSESLIETGDEEWENTLLVGVDTGENGKKYIDQLVVVSFNPSEKRAFMLHIPGETQVYLRDYGGEKVENIYALESASNQLPLLVETVAELLYMPMHYYFEINYWELPQAIKSVKNITVDVKETLTNNQRIVFPRGEYLLEEQVVYQYFTFELEGEHALDRLERQRIFMAALGEKVMGKNLITGLPGSISRLSPLVSTNMAWRELLQYYNHIKDMSYKGQVSAEIIPGWWEEIDEVTYWVVDREETRGLINDLTGGEMLSLESGITLEVLNGKGVGGTANRVSRALSGLGYEVVRVANADHFNYTSTQIISRIEDLETAEIAETLAELFEGSEVEQEIIEGHNAQITIIIGHNFDEKRLTERLQ